ncbi:MAG TPA: hypothetical protein VNZ26_16500 [Vicinamibacterales bacterium]|nr:hypothetical protein [Vicinamibacterales bacterium]
MFVKQEEVCGPKWLAKARRLRAAYLENGQLAWAAEIQKEHAIDA